MDTEGSEETFFNQPPPAAVAAPPAAAAAEAAAAATDQVQQQQQQQQGWGGNDEVQDSVEELPPVIQDIMACGGNNLNADSYMVAAGAAPMVNDNDTIPTENGQELMEKWVSENGE